MNVTISIELLISIITFIMSTGFMVGGYVFMLKSIPKKIDQISNEFKEIISDIKRNHLKAIYDEIDQLKQKKASTEMLEKLEDRLLRVHDETRAIFINGLKELKDSQDLLHSELHKLMKKEKD